MYVYICVYVCKYVGVFVSVCVCVDTHARTHARTHTRTHTSIDIYASRVDEARARGVAGRFSYGNQHAPEAPLRRCCASSAAHAEDGMHPPTRTRQRATAMRSSRSLRRLLLADYRRWKYSRQTSCNTEAIVRRLSFAAREGGGTVAARTEEGTKPSPLGRNCRRSDMDMDME
jgi:hypothetical protein